MQSTRFVAPNMLRQQAAINMIRNRAVPMLRMQPTTAMRGLRMQATPKMRYPVPGEEQSGHTISQRLRKWRSIPPELVPLGIVLAVAIIAAVYSMFHKLFSDKTLRLTRTGSSGKH